MVETLEMSPGLRAELRAILERLQRLDEREIISYWIRSEIDEAEIYNSLANRISQYSWDPRIGRLFKELARESLEHAEVLLKTYLEHYGPPLLEVDLPGIKS